MVLGHQYQHHLGQEMNILASHPPTCWLSCSGGGTDTPRLTSPPSERSPWSKDPYSSSLSAPSSQPAWGPNSAITGTKKKSPSASQSCFVRLGFLEISPPPPLSSGDRQGTAPGPVPGKRGIRISPSHLSSCLGGRIRNPVQSSPPGHRKQVCRGSALASLTK